MNKQIVNYKNDEEMQSIIKAKQRNIKIIQIPMYLSLVGILLPFVGVIFDIYGPIIDTVFRVVPVVCIFIGFLLAILCNKKMKDLRVFIGQNIVLGVLEERIQVIDYSPSGYVDESFLEFTYSDLELKTESQDYTANENNLKTTITEFSGQFMTMALSKSVNGFVQIMGKSNSGKMRQNRKAVYIDEKNNISSYLKTGDRVFDDRFEVNASGDDLAYSILTPQFISGLKKMGKRTRVQLSGNMGVIACYNEKNSFELIEESVTLIFENSPRELKEKQFFNTYVHIGKTKCNTGLGLDMLQ